MKIYSSLIFKELFQNSEFLFQHNFHFQYQHFKDILKSLCYFWLGDEN